MTFIEQQQELAYKSAGSTKHTGLGFIHSFTTEELDALTAQIIQNTGEELMRRIKIEIEDK